MSYFYHPHELSICGYSGCGKTTLLERVVIKFKELYTYKIGYAKHDAHHFSFDYPGKDTFRLRQAGANAISIYNKNQIATISDKSAAHDIFVTEKLRNNFQECDFVLIEGHKFIPLPKIIVLDSQKLILQDIIDKKISSIIAIVSDTKYLPDSLAIYPHFHRDDIEGISIFIIEWLKQNVRKRPRHALILAGGHSRRMGRDKALLSYHSGKNQLEHTKAILAPFCSKVFVSSRHNQWDKKTRAHFDIIDDRFIDFGPMGGILSAMITDPSADWFVLACDMPFVERETISTIIEGHDKINIFAMATLFQHTQRHNKVDNNLEPLCALYSGFLSSRLGSFLMKGKLSLQKLLSTVTVNALSIPLEWENHLQNINEPL